MKKIGICLTTYNRPHYLRQTLDSLAAADLRGAQVLIVDDCSTDIETLKMLVDYRSVGTNRNVSIRHTLQIGFDQLISEGCEVLVNLDADVIVSPDFLQVLMELHNAFPDRIVSGFNTLTKNRKGIPRHPAVESHQGYVIKHSIGGVNMVISADTYQDIVRPALLLSQKNRGDWDTIACRMSMAQGKPIVVSSPSVVQHIGIRSAMGHSDNPDVADDFKYTTCVLQPQGLGDIIFTQTLVREEAQGSIVWPVAPQFLRQLQRAYPDIHWVEDSESPILLSDKTVGIKGNYQVMPIRFSDTITRTPYSKVMRAKYDMYGKDWKDWKRKAMWVRDREKEDELFKLLGLEGKEYVLKNLTFSSTQSKKIDIHVPGVEMQEIEGFSLFDWAKVMEKAKEIHTVSTSILYLLDLLEDAPNVYVYARKPVEKDHRYYDYIFTDSKFIYR